MALENKKHVFWQAFFLTILFFSLGLVLGVYLEQLRSDDANIIFYQSETSLYDSFALSKLLDSSLISCDELIYANVNFADKIYEEAKELEKFDSSNKLTDSIKTIHRKYDLLRTLLWMNLIEVKENCGNINTIVYLYLYDVEDIEKRSKQIVWGKILQDLKEEKGNEVILIPIAVDQSIISLNYLVKKYNIVDFPAVMFNEEIILYEHETVEELKEYFN
tara:strand:- start:4971 stop:5627 length:657 start_codon:yes stop_codon:yes gene_type:complete